MRAPDRWLQRWRISKAIPWVRPGDRILDVGCFDLSLLSRVAGIAESGVGIDAVAEPGEQGNVQLIRGTFPDDAHFEADSFDCITALAVLEHVSDTDRFASECFRLLRPAGRVVATVPHPAVDGILDVLVRLRVIDGMDLEEHHGFDVRQTTSIFRRAGFEVVEAKRFQLGLNHLFVFSKPSA